MQTAPGRPIEIEPEKLAHIGAQLFIAKGFDAVTMDDIAKAASVSRTSLFRLFASKGEIVLGPFGSVSQNLASILDHVPASDRSLDTLIVCFSKSLAVPSEDIELLRSRMKLIRDEPKLAPYFAPLIVSVVEVLKSFLTSEQESTEAGLDANVWAHSLAVTAYSSLIWWAEHSEERPEVIALRSFRKLVHRGSLQLESD